MALGQMPRPCSLPCYTTGERHADRANKKCPRIRLIRVLQLVKECNSGFVWKTKSQGEDMSFLPDGMGRMRNVITVPRHVLRRASWMWSLPNWPIRKPKEAPGFVVRGSWSKWQGPLNSGSAIVPDVLSRSSALAEEHEFFPLDTSVRAVLVRTTVLISKAVIFVTFDCSLSMALMMPSSDGGQGLVTLLLLFVPYA